MRGYVWSQIPIRLFSLFSANVGTLGTYMVVALNILYVAPLDNSISVDDATYKIKVGCGLPCFCLDCGCWQSMMTEVESLTRLLVFIPAFISARRIFTVLARG